MEKKLLVLLIEPVIKKSWLPKLIMRCITKNNLAVYTLERNKIAFKVSLVEGESLPNKLILNEFSLIGKRSIATWNKPFEVEGEAIKKGAETKEKLIVVFPYQDFFTIRTTVNAEPDDFIIETKQRRLTGEEGRGWGNEEKKNICHMPISAVDILSFRVTIYTIMILITTFILLGITLWQIFN